MVPRIYFVSQYAILNDADEILSVLSDPAFDPRKLVILEEGLQEAGAGESKKGTEETDVKIASYSNNRIEVEANVPHKGFLVFSELFYPGWHANVDGAEVKIYRANYAFRAVYLKPGTHRIEMTYEPLSFYLGAGITFSCVFFLVVYYSYRKKKFSRMSPPLRREA